MLPLGPFHTRLQYAGDPVAGHRAWYRGDGYAAGTWTDRSGNGFNLTTGGADPTAVAGDPNFNGLPVVDFNGTTQHLNGTTLSDLIANNAFTIFGVVRGESFGTSDASGVAQRGVFAGTAVGSGIGVGYGLTKLEGWNYDGAADYAGPVVSLNTVYGFDYRHDAGNIKMLLSAGLAEVTVASGNTTLTDTLLVGADYEGNTFFDGQIAELIFYNTVLSAGDRQIVRDYLAQTYGFAW
jgi:hypothetical protein